VDIDIYGNITSCPCVDESTGEQHGISSKGLKAEIDAVQADTINVYINSNGGDVAEAVAICSALSRNPAKVHTYCDGFACSAASVIFCAGDQRTMGKLALLMIHNCSVYNWGPMNADELRKTADDVDKINQASITMYKTVTGMSDDEIQKLMDAETWMTAEEALKYGFATDIADDDESDEGVSQSAMAAIHQRILEAPAEAMLEARISAIDVKMDNLLSALTEPKTAHKEPATIAQNAKRVFATIAKEE
jgi:ATP-dependent protease ClpP protease subunit